MMADKYFIPGTVIITNGVFYARDIIVYASKNEMNAKELKVDDDGLFKVDRDYGSIFAEYYISGDFTLYGGNSYCAVDEHCYTYKQYRECIEQIKRLLNESIIPDELQNLFYQQQYISVFGALECFLYNTFMRQVCNNRDAYKKVITTPGCLGKNIFMGKNELEKEKKFIERAKGIVYHRLLDVKLLFETAFNFNLDLNNIIDKVDTRHHLVHRMGYTKSNNKVYITHEQVISLINEVDLIVNNVTLDIKEFNEKQILE